MTEDHRQDGAVLSDALVKALQDGLQQAIDVGLAEPNAMTVATAGADGRLSARTVLIKDIDAHGIAFYTNLDSHKGRQLRENPRIAACILWRELERQVLVEGTVAPVSDDEADAYFATRPRISQLGAWASRQSRPLADRAELEAALQAMTERFAGQDVPRPPHWSGFRIRPDMVEFWHGREYRLHERVRWQRSDDGTWRDGLLYP
jgi:pyridoxamine 5'-phosphate oxidase